MLERNAAEEKLDAAAGTALVQEQHCGRGMGFRT